MSKPAEDRFRSPDCEAGRHEECVRSPMFGLCGCECHDELDQLEDLYGWGVMSS